MYIFSTEDRARLRAAVENGLHDCCGLERDISLTLLALLHDFEESERARNLVEAYAGRPSRHAVQGFEGMPEDQLAEIEQRCHEAAERLKRQGLRLDDVSTVLDLMHRLPALAREVRRLKLLLDELLHAGASTTRQ